MKRKAFRAGVACGILLGTTIIAYAITALFFTKSETSKLSKKTVAHEEKDNNKWIVHRNIYSNSHCSVCYHEPVFYEESNFRVF